MKHISQIWVAAHSIAALALSLAGCGIDLDEEDDEQVGETSSEVLGSIADTTHDSVCAMEIADLPNEVGDPQPSPPTFRCSCTLVEAQTILTSAICVREIVEKGALTDIDVRFGDSFTDGTPFEVEEIQLHRYFDEKTGGPDQLALVRLTAAPDATPVELNIEDAPQPAMPVTMVGFGEAQEDGATGSRRSAETPIVTVQEKFIQAGTADLTTCAEDSGGPVFGSFDGETEVLVAVTGGQSDCTTNVQRLRVDAYAKFIVPYVDYYSGACPHDDADTCSTDGCRTPDPDCPESSCNWGNECDEDCPTRDWDCPLGKFIGEACAASGECEEGGGCIAATDDETFTYCSRPCTMGVDGTCPTGMECSAGENGDECVFLEPSPGSQGATCSDNSGCRSDICENDICVFPCDASTPCDPPYQCGPSTVADGMMVCLGNVIEGGGGFGLCAAGGDSRGWLSALGLLGLAVLFRRRRPRKSSDRDLRG
ncbi:MAG TPA: trypsin-like serine protease [Kofleriaceae bacterium]|nr:trypsin-like serine protease [Kofleriaceae bacterium]